MDDQERSRYCAKIKADSLEARRRLTALLDLGGLDPEDEAVLAVKELIRRISINREFAWRRLRHADSEETGEWLKLLKADSYRTLSDLKRLMHHLAPGAIDLSRNIPADKDARGFAKVIPPIFVEKLPAVAEEYAKLGWRLPPPYCVKPDLRARLAAMPGQQWENQSPSC